MAAGYLKRPELTRERFVPDPFAGSGNLYRTGDRVRLRPDGNLEFLGRLDGQVKIAGHRLEPGEIEAALLRHSAVRQAAVTTRQLPSGEKQLVAYVVASDPVSFSAAGLKSDLGKCLPCYMVPAQVVCVDRLPLTANGKVDRAALPAPDQPTAPVLAPSSPGTGLEREVAAIWGRVLGRNVGPNDNFFEMGGSSLQLLEVHAALTRTLGREVPLMLLFEHPTVRSLARRLSEASAADPALAAVAERARLQRAALARRRIAQ